MNAFYDKKHTDYLNFVNFLFTKLIQQTYYRVFKEIEIRSLRMNRETELVQWCISRIKKIAMNGFVFKEKRFIFSSLQYSVGKASVFDTSVCVSFSETLEISL